MRLKRESSADQLEFAWYAPRCHVDDLMMWCPGCRQPSNLCLCQDV